MKLQLEEPDIAMTGKDALLRRVGTAGGSPYAAAATTRNGNRGHGDLPSVGPRSYTCSRETVCVRTIRNKEEIRPRWRPWSTWVTHRSQRCRAAWAVSAVRHLSDGSPWSSTTIGTRRDWVTLPSGASCAWYRFVFSQQGPRIELYFDTGMLPQRMHDSKSSPPSLRRWYGVWRSIEVRPHSRKASLSHPRRPRRRRRHYSNGRLGCVYGLVRRDDGAVPLGHATCEIIDRTANLNRPSVPEDAGRAGFPPHCAEAVLAH